LLFDLLGYAKRMNNKEFLDRMTIYIKPGMFEMNSSGEITLTR
jgi:hypothetical protein